MFKNLVLAATAAAIAVPLTAPDFAGGSTAQARSAQHSAQSGQLKAPAKRPVKPAPGPVKPMDGLGSRFIDLAGEYMNPVIQEGKAGSHYCSSEPGNGRSRYVQIVVRNKGNTFATPVQVSFTFATGQFLTHTIPMIQAGAAKGSAVAIPDSAWKNGKAQFHISIDPTNSIGESNEGNNSFHSFCTDPN
ncbi:CARDB domain-containing protein [Pelagibius sp. CAU 1746]|uniref:CARDB domain-containing protein n=1 Tax=Pelagibius sp. CAU 1746 TaxID=3140370 RepID=UPI00325A4A18